MALRRRSLVLTLAVSAFLVTGGCVVLNLPTTTREAVDGRVTTRTTPLYVKAIDFLQRHYQYKLLVSRICSARETGAGCVTALFDWTYQNIVSTPAGWPLLDDHVLNIIIRRHGRDWQKALVFTTLSTYAGAPGFIMRVKEPHRRGELILSFVRLGDQWVPFDVEHHVSFRDSRGRFLDVDTLVRNPAVVDAGRNGTLPGDLKYSDFISSSTLAPFAPPPSLHADRQRPWARVRYELRRLVGLEVGTY